MLTLVYIAGYGRSGSTVLDVVLGNHPSVFSTGELQLLFSEFQGGEGTIGGGWCSCGEAVAHCPVWSTVVGRLLQEGLVTEIAEAEAITRSVDYRQFPLRRQTLERYTALWGHLLQALAGVTGAQVIVDSSKTTREAWRRVWALARLPDVQVKVVHLVRDLHAVMASSKRGSSVLLERGAPRPAPFAAAYRAVYGWTLANLLGSIASRWVGRENYLALRFEDLLASPAEAFRLVGRFLGLDLRAGEFLERVEQGGPFAVGHGVAGNRFRRRGQQVWLRPPSEPAPALNPLERLATLLALPVRRRFAGLRLP